ncbi:hypothetical protein KEC55_07830 [Burkholderia cepacia]|uniref:hypothetical protein n=1 Tax=Burkholderia cepacia TaxID=292 RepID=UPI00249E82D0|nr:hypothetical protein [Burkholderia cepacia]WGY69865.1 hypothetical protein KEC55_07830 [Burkholderia cepacia]
MMRDKRKKSRPEVPQPEIVETPKQAKRWQVYVLVIGGVVALFGNVASSYLNRLIEPKPVIPQARVGPNISIEGSKFSNSGVGISLPADSTAHLNLKNVQMDHSGRDIEQREAPAQAAKPLGDSNNQSGNNPRVGVKIRGGSGNKFSYVDVKGAQAFDMEDTSNNEVGRLVNDQSAADGHVSVRQSAVLNPTESEPQQSSKKRIGFSSR